MPKLIAEPAVIRAAGNKPKRIEELAGRLTTGHGGAEYIAVRTPAFSPETVHRGDA